MSSDSLLHIFSSAISSLLKSIPDPELKVLCEFLLI
jgi:hypothetical protein